MGHPETLQGRLRGGNSCKVSSLWRSLGKAGLGEEEDCAGCCGLEEEKAKAAALKYFGFSYNVALITAYSHA